MLPSIYTRNLNTTDYNEQASELKHTRGEKAKYERLRCRIKTCETLLSNLEAIRGKKKNGMELGPLRFSVELIGPIGAADVAPVSRLFHEQLANILTPLGVAAWNYGKVSGLISANVLAKFRNPPAHTSFTPLSVSKEAKEYVENNLADFFAWFKE